MARPLKILFLLEDLCYGGTQKQSVALAARLNRELFAPSVLTLTGPTDLDAVVRDSGVPVVNMSGERSLAPFFFVRLPRWLKDARPDILVLCTALPNIWGRIWGRATGIPLVIGGCRGGGAPARQHERLLWRLADHIVCNSRASLDAMRQKGAPDDRLTYIANGVDSELFAPDPAARIPGLILCVARLAADKDHQTLIEAFAKLAPLAPGAALRLVGDGPLMADLRSFVAQLPPDVARRVEFAGASADPSRHYREASAFALSSIRESQPNSVIEAMSSALPVCATAVGGLPQLISPGRNGLLSPAGDADALAANLLEVLNNPRKAAEMGEAARRAVDENFSYKKMVAAHENLFLELWNAKTNRKTS